MNGVATTAGGLARAPIAAWGKSKLVSPRRIYSSLTVAAIHAIQGLLAAPALLVIATLTCILFRPPDVGLFPVDRIAFLSLLLVVMLRMFLLRQQVPAFFSLTVLMCGLLSLAIAGHWVSPFDSEMWSLVAAKFVVPFAFFHLAALVFTTESAVKKLEIFFIAVLAYLCFINTAFVAGGQQLIFPRFILDGGVEMHADRARGPFLQAVANGITLNLLGIIVLDIYRRGQMRAAIALPLLLLLPVAVFATFTRSVWISFALSISAIAFFNRRGRFRNPILCLGLGSLLLICLAAANSALRLNFRERLASRDTVEFRVAVYQLSYDMFREKPLLGWGQGQLAREIEARITDFRPEAYAAHNTFIEILVEHGIVGISLYTWMVIGLFRLGGRSPWLQSSWPIFLGVYVLNACFVVLNYQFVNALVFTCAGVLASNRSTSRAGELVR